MALTAVACAVVLVCKALSTAGLVSAHYSAIETLFALATAVDTINRGFVVSDLWIMKNTTLFTFATGNMILNSMTMLLFHANFYGIFVKTEGVSKSSPKLLTIVTVLSFIFGFNFIRILTSGFFFRVLTQPFKNSLDYEREVRSMGTYTMAANAVQIIIYVGCYFIGISGLPSVGIVLSTGLVAAQAKDIIFDYLKYQAIKGPKHN